MPSIPLRGLQGWDALWPFKKHLYLGGGLREVCTGGALLWSCLPSLPMGSWLRMGTRGSESAELDLNPSLPDLTVLFPACSASASLHGANGAVWTRTSEAHLPVLLWGLPAGGGLHQAPLKEGEAEEGGGRGRRSKALLLLRWGLSRGSGSHHLDKGLVEEQTQLHSRLSANASCGQVLSLFLVF